MKTCILKNEINVVYEHREGNITSFCIGFDAGALREREDEIGIAHVVEHMLFKGTNKRTEFEINKSCDEIFGFNNAMTNFPYAIYYGTTLSEDFSKGFDIYSNIVMKPSFREDGFKEEINVICEELKEWKEDNFQLCEDEILKNAFKNRRIKTCIIGEEKTIKNFSILDVTNFYDRYYNPDNCVISVISSLAYDEVIAIVKGFMEEWKGNKTLLDRIVYEKNIEGTFIKNKPEIEGAKIQYCFSIDKITERELMAFNIFNNKFGIGVSSILYNNIRTKQGLAYDVFSRVKNETGIKLFTIALGTSVANVYKAIDIIDEHLKDIDNYKGLFSKDNIDLTVKAIKLKKELEIEKSIELCKVLTTNKIMYDKFQLLNFQHYYGEKNIDGDEIILAAKKVLKNPTIQILA